MGLARSGEALAFLFYDGVDQGPHRIGDCGAGVMVIGVGIGDCCISEFGCSLVAEVSCGVGASPWGRGDGAALTGPPQRS